MKLILLSVIFLSFTFLMGNIATASIPVRRQENRNAEEEFCQKYPLNKKCSDFIPDNNSNLIEAEMNNLELEKAFLCNTIMPNFSVAKDGCNLQTQ